MPRKTDVNWPVLQVEFSHGVSIPELSRKYGVPEGTIKARSARNKWMNGRPLDVQKAVAKQQPVGATGLQLALEQGAKSASLSLSERGQAYSSRIFDKVSSLVEKANLPEPKNWKDAEIADRIARRASGLDKVEMSINTIIGMAGSVENEPIIDITPPIESGSPL